MRAARWGWPAGYVGTIFAANWLVQHFGAIPVGFGFLAPAGSLVAGLAFSLRDMTEEELGRKVVLVCIGIGAACSALVSPTLAFASSAAFLTGEALDMVVYEPLRANHWPTAVFASGAVGSVVDSVVFLTLSGFGLGFLPGQLLAKTYSTLVFLAILVPLRRARREKVPA